MGLYARVAMETHRPIISEKKKEELRKIVETLTNKTRKEKPRYFDHSKLPIGGSLPYRGQSYSNVVDGSSGLIKKKKKKLKSSKVNQSVNSLSKVDTIINSPAPYTSKAQDDWNTKKRMERERREEESGKRRNPNLISLITETAIKEEGIKEKAEFDLLKEKVKAIDEQANRKEKVLDIGATNADNYAEVNDMYIASIKAKLTLLNGV